MIIGLILFKDYGFKFGLVDGVWKMLCFETKAISFLINFSAFPGSIRQKISGIELYSWLCRKNFEEILPEFGSTAVAANMHVRKPGL